jgi:CheY-specific phosphatase CheX
MRITGPAIRQTAGYKPPSAELVASIFRLVRDQPREITEGTGSSKPLSTQQLAQQLRHDIGTIKRGCELLESHDVITRAWAADSHTSPHYRVTSVGNFAAMADAQCILDYIHSPLSEVIAQSWGRNFGTSLDLASLAIGSWEKTDEDVTAFACAAGQAEGSVALSMNRGFLRKSLAHTAGHNFREFDDTARNFFRTLIGHVISDAGREISASGFDVLLSPNVTLVNRGALLSKPRDSRYLIDLTNRYGRLKVRITLRDVVSLQG